MEQTVLVTGAGRGLGFSLASKFLQEGFRVFAGKHVTAVNLQGLAKQFPERLVVVPLDVTDMDSIRQAAHAVAEQIPGLDILINNAAIYIDDTRAPLEELEFTNVHEMFDVNTIGPLRVTQQFYPLLEKGKRKLIINISSEAGSIADCRRRQEYIYCMTKAALNMQSKILQNYLQPKKFKVLAVHPGWMRTDMGGPDAGLHPDEPAASIFELAMKDWRLEDAIYIDRDGKPRRW
jgi:NAD(P)-dependent dehydrogenase (short-subunit alcohol dehydrogenase family)